MWRRSKFSGRWTSSAPPFIIFGISGHLGTFDSFLCKVEEFLAELEAKKEGQTLHLYQYKRSVFYSFSLFSYFATCYFGRFRLLTISCPSKRFLSFL
jgi:hypothetical protein